MEFSYKESKKNRSKSKNKKEMIYPQWAANEKLHGQKFFYNEMYISTSFLNDNVTESNENILQSNSQCSKRVLENTENNSPDLLSFIKSFEEKRKQFNFPDPGLITQSVLKSFEVFSEGLYKLFPNGEIMDDAKDSVQETDKIYLLIGLYSVICKVDYILQKQILNMLEKMNFQVNFPVKTVNILSSFIDEAMLKTLDGDSQNGPVSEVDVLESSKENSKSWAISKVRENFFLKEHQIEFIDNNQYICFVCCNTFSSSPDSHIISPIHIRSLASS